MLLSDIGEFFTELIFPNKCIFCDDVAEAGADKYICGKCSEFYQINTEIYGRVLSLYKYEGYVKDMLHRFKYSGCTAYSKKLGGLLAEKVRIAGISDADIIVPVPMHKLKKLKRGYNQAELLAKELEDRLGIKMVGDAISRKRFTKPQSFMSREERNKNVQGAFVLTEPSAVEGKNVILVDDIYTSGSTANACIEELEKGGVGKVYVLVVAAAGKGTQF